MGADAADLARALDALREELGADQVLSGPDAADAIRGRSLNARSDPAPRYLLRPRDTDECRTAVGALASVGCRAAPVAGLTTFWEPYTADAEVCIDTLFLRAPMRVDAGERIAYCGAGVSVREIDRLARAAGLCLLAYPDSDGSQSVGSMAAVGCTTGLGMGRIGPVEQISGLTVVTPDATVVKTGASWRLGRGGAAHGMADPTGVFLGAQGASGVITEVVLSLWPAPYLAACWWRSAWLGADLLADRLRRARQCLDWGTVDSLRLETVCAGRDEPAATEWFARCWAPDSARAADRHSAALAAHLEARDARDWIESEAGRRGELTDHDQRYSVPPGEHHARTGREGFLGLEVNVNWGEALEVALRSYLELFAALGRLGLGHRRLGIYPGAHTVSIGVQTMLSGGEATADAVREVLAEYVEPLTALGAVPYRAGRLWRPLIERMEVDDPACAMIRRALASGPRS